MNTTPRHGLWTPEGLHLLTLDAGVVLVPAAKIKGWSGEYGRAISIKLALDKLAEIMLDNPNRIRPRRYLEANVAEWLDKAASEFPELYQTDRHREQLEAEVKEQRRLAGEAKHQERVAKHNRSTAIRAAEQLVDAFESHLSTEVVVEGFRDRHGHQVALTRGQLDRLVERNPDLNRDQLVAEARRRVEHFNRLTVEERPTGYEGLADIVAGRIRLAHGADFDRVAEAWLTDTALVRRLDGPAPWTRKRWKAEGEHVEPAPCSAEDVQFARAFLADPDGPTRGPMVARLIELGRLAKGADGQLDEPVPDWTTRARRRGR